MDDEQVKKEIRQADLQAVNDIRKAIYDYEFKALSILQVLSGGAATLFISFLSESKITYSPLVKGFFSFTLIFLLIALGFSIVLVFIYPKFIEARFRINENKKTYEQYESKRKYYLSFSIGCFILAILMAMLGWLHI